MAIITGNNQDNLIEGTVADEIILAGGGDDIVNAGGGDDLVLAGSGDDTVDAGDGNDLVFAGKGDDTVDAGGGDDLVFAGSGDDIVDGGEGNDIVFAGKGDDTVIHIEGDNLDSENWYFGEAGTDTLRLVVSLETFNSAAFQQELAAFQAMIDAGGSATGHFTTLGIHFSSFETIEVIPDNLPPTSISLSNASVLENHPGAVIGTLSAIDPNGDAGLTFSLAEGLEAYYEIVDGTTLKLRDDVSFDREALFFPPAPSAVVTVTDPGGLTYTQEFAIEVLDVDEPPQSPIPLTGESAPAVSENMDGATFYNFAAADPEGGALTFVVSDDRFEVVQTSGITYDLKLKDGISLDYETEPDVAVMVTMTDPGGLSKSRTFNLSVFDGAPTAIALDNATVDENAIGAEIGNLTITDPDGDTTFNISVDDSRFEVVDGVLKLADGESLDFESEPTVSVAVTAAGDGGFFGFTETFDIQVGDVNEAPTALALDNTSVVENEFGAIVGAVTVTDPDGETEFSFSVDDPRFEVVDGMLKLVDGESLDFEGEPTVAVDVTAEDAGGLAVTETFDIQVEDINEAPQIVRPVGLIAANIAIVLSVAVEPGLAQVVLDPGVENTPGDTFGILSASDPDGEPLTVELSDSRFEAVQIAEFVTPGTVIPPELEPVLSGVYVVKLLDDQMLDHEVEPGVSLTATVTDAGGLTASTTFGVGVGDVNEAPTAIALDNNPIDENELGAVVGAVTVTDPDGDIDFDFDLSDDRFEVAGGMLKLKDGESLDYETVPQVDLDITAIDPFGLSHTEMFVIQVTDVQDGVFL